MKTLIKSIIVVIILTILMSSCSSSNQIGCPTGREKSKFLTRQKLPKFRGKLVGY